MYKNFLSKLEKLSTGRDITPWLKSLGFSSGIIGRVLSGEQPGAELLRALARTERVSLRWLDEGRGEPYEVSHVTDDDAAIKLLGKLLDEDFSLGFVTADDEQFSIVLHCDAEYEYKNKHVPYRVVEVVAGPITLKAVQWLANQGRALWALSVTADEATRLASGNMGNIELFGYTDSRKSRKGLWENVRSTLHDSPYQFLHDNTAPVPARFQVAEQGASYALDDSHRLKAAMKSVRHELESLNITLPHEKEAELVSLLFDESKRTHAQPPAAWVARLVKLISSSR